MDNNEVCILRKKESVSELFQKSLKYFVTIITVIFTVTSCLNIGLSINPLYVLFVIGLYCCLLTTYYKYMIFVDPNYKPKCMACVGANDNKSSIFDSDTLFGILTVLDHKKATMLFNVPNSIYGILFYSFMIAMNFYQYQFIMQVLTIISCLGSLFLWFTMVTEVKSICILCTTIHCVNFLTLYYLY
jgi:uncharacterized membrane protein